MTPEVTACLPGEQMKFAERISASCDPDPDSFHNIQIEDETTMEQPTDHEIEELLEQACVGSLDHLVEMLTYDPIAEVWNQFGIFAGIARSPRPGEHGYYVISEHTPSLCLSFQLPFDGDGRLAGCGRVVLETREEELETRVLTWETSCAIWEELADEFLGGIENLPLPSLDGSWCEADHRLLAALHDRMPSTEAGLRLIG